MRKSIDPNLGMGFLGVVLAILGVAVCLTIRVSSFARYMWLEDLGLDVDPNVSPELFRKLVALTPTDTAMFFIALALIPLGLLLVTIAAVKHKRKGRESLK